MVLSSHGRTTDLLTLRAQYPISLKGMTLKTLITLATELGMQCRPIKSAIGKVKNATLPCILHWDMNHYVVLAQTTSNSFIVHDPALGVRTLGEEEFSKHFTGILLELVPGPAFAEGRAIARWSPRMLLGRINGLGRSLGLLLVCGIALQGVTLALPLYLQWNVDEAIAAADRNLVYVLGSAFLLVVLFQAAIMVLRAWLTSTISSRINFQWMANAFGHLQRLPLTYFEKRHVGDIVSRFRSIESIQRAVTTQFVEAVIDGGLVSITAAVMFAYSPRMAVISAGAVAIYYVFRTLTFAELRQATSEQIAHGARQQTHFLESVRGAQSIRLFNRGPTRSAAWLNYVADQLRAELRVSKVSVLTQGANVAVFGLERIVVIWVAILLVIDASFTLGMLFAYLSFREQFSLRAAALVDKAIEWQMLRLHGERIADIMLSPAENDVGFGGKAPLERAPLIELRDVRFRYGVGEPYVLRGVTLSITPGEFVSIAGASGCGKSTLVKVLTGLCEPESGEVLVGGLPLASFGASRYRAGIGTVMQDDRLFSGSISQNISFFDEVYDEQLIREVARAANIAAEIDRMPMGYNTLISDAGSGLSGGQRQRILLARALYRRPQILILDEATNQLDEQGENIISEAIRGLRLTRVVVAHRRETIAMADRVVMMDAGRIASDDRIERK